MVSLATTRRTTDQKPTPRASTNIPPREEIPFTMCRNIKNLFNFEPPVTGDEIQDAALQFVRKISGFSKPSKVNEAAFHLAVDEITSASARLLESLQTNALPKDREEHDAKKKARDLERFAPR